MEAQIILEYSNPKTAQAIAKAVSPDNTQTPKGLEVKTYIKKCAVITEILCHKELSTFIATVDDLLSCTTTAEKTIRFIDTDRR